MTSRTVRNTVLAIVSGAWMVLLAGCAVGPKYRKPVVSIPDVYPNTTAEPISTPEPVSVGDEKWWKVFQDKQLQGLIRIALQQNYDVRIAATRILQAQAQLGITRADQLPVVAAGAGSSIQRNSGSRFFDAFNTSANEANVVLSWELDFWGRFRRGTVAARATLLASEWGRRAVISTMVSDVASAYFQLRALDLQLEISKRTFASRQDSLQLTQRLEQRGISSLLDVRQGEQLVSTAAGEIVDLEKRIAQQENLISILLGRNPDIVGRGLSLTEQPHPLEVPAGLPSSLLERRPDIRAAEAQLVAFNARIGVAKTAYFPRVALTKAGGFQSTALTSLFTGPAGLWSFVGGLTQPIFTAGRVRSEIKLTEAQEQEALFVYQQSVQQAFREVSDALVAYRKNQEFRAQQEQLTNAAQDAARLSESRYRAGTTSYLEVLTSQTNYFSAELGLAQSQLN